MRCPTLLLGLALLVTPAARGDDPADALLEKYQRIERDPKNEVPARRLDALRAIATKPSPRVREILLKIARTARSADDRLVAIAALGRMADLETAKAMLRCVETRPDPVFSEVLGEALAAGSDPAVAAWIVAEGLQATRQDLLVAFVRAAGALALAEAEGPLAAICAKAATGVGGVEVATEALRALGRAGGAASLPLLLEAAKKPDFRFRLAAAEALARRAPPTEETVRALTLLLQDPHDAVRLVTTVEAGRAKIEPLFPEIVARFEDARLRTRRAAYDALRAISGRDFHYDAAAWRQWWKQRDLPDRGDDGSFTFARWFGHSVMSDRAVFLVDLSGSMDWPRKSPPTRIEVARREMKAALAGLPKGALFNIVVFSDRVRSWQKAEVEATPESTAKAVAWVEKTFATPDGQTATFDALEEVFGRNSKFDTIYFVTDGIPSDGAYISHEGIFASVRLWNRHRRAVIHTVALTLDRGLPDLAPKYEGEKDFMRRLAEATGGESRVIASAPN